MLDGRGSPVPHSTRFLVRFDCVGELLEIFFNFPCPCPISDLALETSPLALLSDTMFQCSEFAAKHQILAEKKSPILSWFQLNCNCDVTIPSESQSGTEIVRAIPDVYDAVIVHTMAFEERVKLAACDAEMRRVSNARMSL
jgi:hypothetical protein